MKEEEEEEKEKAQVKEGQDCEAGACGRRQSDDRRGENTMSLSVVAMLHQLQQQTHQLRFETARDSAEPRLLAL